MKFLVILEADEDGFIVAECPQLPGCLSQGRTREEALDNIREAIRASLITRRERGLPLSLDTAEVEVAV
jgi:predicted RNase H-like HicB family nuclease